MIWPGGLAILNEPGRKLDETWAYVEVLSQLMAQLDTGLNADAGGVLQVPASTYTCPDLAKHGWQTFFRGPPRWLGCPEICRQPGSYMTRNDVGMPLLVTRGADGRVRACLNSYRRRVPWWSWPAEVQFPVFVPLPRLDL
jgi:hypothetical protein